MKPGRQNVILEIIAEQDIETQHQLLKALEARGVKSTQATLSRDIKDMHLIKEQGPGGNYRYVASSKPETDDFDLRLKKIFRESVISYDIAQNLLIIKTLPVLPLRPARPLTPWRSGALWAALPGMTRPSWPCGTMRAPTAFTMR